jgi:hypothetical protein
MAAQQCYVAISGIHFGVAVFQNGVFGREEEVEEFDQHNAACEGQKHKNKTKRKQVVEDRLTDFHSDSFTSG